MKEPEVLGKLVVLQGQELKDSMKVVPDNASIEVTCDTMAEVEKYIRNGIHGWVEPDNFKHFGETADLYAPIYICRVERVIIPVVNLRMSVGLRDAKVEDSKKMERK